MLTNVSHTSIASHTTNKNSKQPHQPTEALLAAPVPLPNTSPQLQYFICVRECVHIRWSQEKLQKIDLGIRCFVFFVNLDQYYLQIQAAANEAEKKHWDLGRQ